MGSKHYGFMNHSYNDVFAYEDEFFHNWVEHMRTALDLNQVKKLRLPVRVRMYKEKDVLSILGEDEIDRLIAFRKPKRIPLIHRPYPFIKSLELDAISNPDRKMSIAFKTEKTPAGYQMKKNLEQLLVPYQAADLLR